MQNNPFPIVIQCNAMHGVAALLGTNWVQASCEVVKTGMSEHLNRKRNDFSKECTNDELDAWALSKLRSTENL